MDKSRLDDRMQQPDFYPEPTRRVERLETHISWVYLLDNHVYKVKRPKNYGFLDFTTLERRRQACHEELRLNRRFAPQTYLEVVPITRDASGFQLRGTGPVVEYAVRMKRLPAERMLCHLLQQNAPLTAAMGTLGRHLVGLHRAAPVCRGDEGRSDADHLRQNWRENLDQIAPFLGETLAPSLAAALRHRVETFLARERPALRQREDQGWVREVHGDLHTEHICLTDPIQIFDCIEFNRRFRVSDILADLAFLRMDLQHHGRRDLADALWAAYRAALPLADPDDGKLLRHYELYRACVRGKVASFLSRDPDLDAAAQQQSREMACRYFNLAGGNLLPPLLLLVSGVMGCGKSSLAQGLAAATGWPVLRSDVVRDRLFPRAEVPDAFGTGRYTLAARDAVYRALREEASRLLPQGQGVLVDAAFTTFAWREQFRQLARTFHRPCLVLDLHCPEAVVRQRLAARWQQGDDPSEGRPEWLPLQQAAQEPVRAQEPGLGIDTTTFLLYTVNTTLGQLLEIVGDQPWASQVQSP